jgi:hypothetical protein
MLSTTEREPNAAQALHAVPNSRCVVCGRDNAHGLQIAVPTNDGITLSEHCGASAAFLIFELENGLITKREMRLNRAHHAGGEGNAIMGEARVTLMQGS